MRLIFAILLCQFGGQALGQHDLNTAPATTIRTAYDDDELENPLSLDIGYLNDGMLFQFRRSIKSANTELEAHRRAAIDNGFMRFGRDNIDEPYSMDVIPLKPGRAAGDNLMRFGRSGEHLMRLGRGDDSRNMMRFGRQDLMRFGKRDSFDANPSYKSRINRAGENLMRFGRSDKSLMRFGKRSGDVNPMPRYSAAFDDELYFVKPTGTEKSQHNGEFYLLPPVGNSINPMA